MKQILIIEDNAINMELIVQLLEDDFEILTAEDGEAGLELGRAEVAPDLILCDISLPKLDGIEIAKRLKADERTRSIPLVALTAHAIKGDRERAMAAGFDAYVTKPIDEDELYGTIAHIIGAPGGP